MFAHQKASSKKLDKDKFVDAIYRVQKTRKSVIEHTHNKHRLVVGVNRIVTRF